METKSTHQCRDISPGCLHCPTAEKEDDITAVCADQRRLRILHAPPNTAPDQRGGSPHQGDVNNGAREGSSGAKVSCNVNVEAAAMPRFTSAC